MASGWNPSQSKDVMQEFLVIGEGKTVRWMRAGVEGGCSLLGIDCKAGKSDDVEEIGELNERDR